MIVVGTLELFDVLENRFPRELLRKVRDFLPLRDLILYGNTSRRNRLHVQYAIRQTADNEIRRFCANPIAFRAMLWDNKSMVSGSVALAALVPRGLRAWQPTDVDVYTPSKRVNRVLKYLERTEGYKVFSKSFSNLSGYPDVGAVKEIVTLRDEQARHIDVIGSDQRSIFGLVFRFYGSYVFNGITGRGLMSMYPQQKLAGNSLWNLNAHRAGWIPIGVQKAMVKYTVRGYDFSINPILYLEHPHKCGHSKSCPHTRRNMFDSGVMALLFPEDGVTDNGFLWNGVSFIYNLQRGNLWCLGGYPCKWDGDSMVEAAHFLVEARCKTILANERGNGDETSW